MRTIKELRISDDLALPLDAVTRTNVVYGGKGKGKTNWGAVLCEELSKAGLRFCVLDPLDVWWGLQYGSDKDSPGINVVILGGTHGDIPIEPTAGAVIADFVADEAVSTVIVMRKATGEMWSNTERIRFMRDFVRRIFARQGERRIPLHIVIDEAGRFVPQIAPKGALDISDCIGAIEELVEWGRNVGVGVTLITQRSARMNKSVSELAECMVAFQTAGPNSIAAIVDWFGEHINKARQNELIEVLRKLPVGRALIVSPEWLDYEGEAQIRLRETFDSSATPKVGGALSPPGKAKKPDLEKYLAKMQETVEKAKSDDPRELRKQIIRLTADLAKQASAPAVREVQVPVEVPVEVQVIPDGLVDRIGSLADSVRSMGDDQLGLGKDLVQAAKELSDVVVGLIAMKVQSSTPAAPAKRPIYDRAKKAIEAGELILAPPPAGLTAGNPKSDGEDAVRYAGDPNGFQPTPSQQRILNTIAWFSSVGITTPGRENVAVLSGFKASGGGFRNYLSTLRTNGLIEYPSDGDLGLTELGKSVAEWPDQALTLEALHEAWYDKIPNPQARLLAQLVAIYPDHMDRESLASAEGYQVTGGGFRNYLSALKTMKLITYPSQGTVAASPILFPAGLK